ncbi:lasso peptide biosynthesis B2 protein [Nocardia tengchongensis]|uniref:lasso peptide biosynthesis B2 protein n=1 Tax=Nocardia tengchongensis TaxID=2055889 RepID=UPI00364D72DE
MNSDVLETRYHRSWSNGKCVELDLHVNRYNLVEPAPAEAPIRSESRVRHRLRDIQYEHQSLVPPLRSIASFGRSAISASRLRRAPIREQLEFCRNTIGSRPTTGTEIELLEENARVYAYLRALRRREALCLEDSICAYLYFNSLTGVCADIVLGVTVQPTFQAHAWVEADGYLLNDLRWRIESYREILRVSPRR